MTLLVTFTSMDDNYTRRYGIRACVFGWVRDEEDGL